MSPSAKPTDDGHDIVVHLDALLTDRDMTLTELVERVGMTIANVSILKNGHAKAMRFATLTAICRELHCQPAYLPHLQGIRAATITTFLVIRDASPLPITVRRARMPRSSPVVAMRAPSVTPSAAVCRGS